MKKLIIVVFLCLITSSVFAGSIVFTITATGVNASKTYTISDADLNKIIATNQIAANAQNNAPASKMYVLNYWITKFINDTTLAVQSYDRQQAIDALPTPTPINPQ